MINPKADLLSVVSGISTIPTLPTVVSQITKLLQNPQTSAEEVGKAITNDQALASKVLKLVNSAFYGFPGRISTITHAVVILGFSTIKNVVLTASIFEQFKKDVPGAPEFDMQKFWLHSVSCGAAAHALARICGSREAEECFIGGLIHDIGKIILFQYLPREFNEILTATAANKCLFIEAERSLYSATHQEIGGFLAQRWNLPSSLQTAVRYHHDPMSPSAGGTMTAIVHVADILVRAMDYGNGGDNRIPVVSEQAWKMLGLDGKPLKPILEAVAMEVDRAQIFMQI